MKLLKQLILGIYPFVLPYTCVLCNAKSMLKQDLCKDCKSELPWITYRCQQCGRPLMMNLNQCGDCLKNPPAYDQAYALFTYQPPINKLIIQMKFHNKLVYAHLLANLLIEKMSEHYAQTRPQLLIPVPLHSQRLSERGFNQALELAKPIAKKLQIPLAFNAASRTRATAAQSLIQAKHRRSNVKNAFKVVADLTIKHIAIVDDVMTTGHTVNELSIALKKTGVERIDVWCCGRTARE